MAFWEISAQKTISGSMLAINYPIITWHSYVNLNMRQMPEDHNGLKAVGSKWQI